MSGVVEIVDMDYIVCYYYYSYESINLYRIVLINLVLDYLELYGCG